MEEMLMTSPSPRAASNVRNARTAANGPRQFTRKISSINRSSNASRSLCWTNRVMPAQFTSTSVRPCGFSTSVASARNASLSSTAICAAECPSPGRVATRSRAARSPLLYVTTQIAPASAKWRQIAEPIAPEPPTITATWSCKLREVMRVLNHRRCHYWDGTRRLCVTVPDVRVVSPRLTDCYATPWALQGPEQTSFQGQRNPRLSAVEAYPEKVVAWCLMAELRAQLKAYA